MVLDDYNTSAGMHIRLRTKDSLWIQSTVLVLEYSLRPEIVVKKKLVEQVLAFARNVMIIVYSTQ